jgi:hypothetical protein
MKYVELVWLSEFQLVNKDPASCHSFVIYFPFLINKDVAVFGVNLYPIIYLVGCVNVFCCYETLQLNIV